MNKKLSYEELERENELLRNRDNQSIEKQLQERIKELDGLYSLGLLTEKYDNIEDVYNEFVNKVLPESFQYPSKIYVLLEIDNKKYSNNSYHELSSDKNYLKGEINVFNKEIGKLIVTYTEDLPFIDHFEQKLIDAYAERISKIVQRKRVEEIAKKSEQRYIGLVETLDETIIVIDTNGVYEFINKEGAGRLGYKQEEVIGISMYDIFPKEIADFQINQIRKACNSKEILIVQSQSKINDNNIWVETRLKPVINSRGEYDKVIGVVFNISKIKEYEIELIKAKEKAENQQSLLSINQSHYQYINKLNEEMSIGIKISTLLEKICNHFSQIHNLRATDLFFSHHDHNGAQYIKLFHTSIESKTLQIAEKLTGGSFKNHRMLLFPGSTYEPLYKNKSVVEVNGFKNMVRIYEDMVLPEKKILRKIAPAVNKMMGFHNVYMVPLVVNNKPAGHLEFFSDEALDVHVKQTLDMMVNEISNLIRRDEINYLLQKSKEKAEESDKLKSAFLANMSHEIRTPMNAILGFSNFLKKDNLSKEKKLKYIELIESGGNRLLHLISDIVDVSKIDANQLSINYEACNVNNLIGDLQDQFKIDNLNKGCDIHIKNGLDDAKSNIFTDETRLSQILSNLLENAIKFTNKGNVEFGYIKKKKMLEFFVKDEGIGIDKKYHNSIFERFSQVDSDYSGSGSGTGLGLSIVKSLTEFLGGKVWVESEINKGAAFYFTIPYNRAKHIDIETHEINHNFDLDEEVTILIAEDEYSNYLYLEALFENYKYNLIHAKNGREAVEMFLKNDSIDLILMDIKMPIMNGAEATKKIRQTNKNIPIIALTAYAMAEDKQRVLNAGCDDYVSKPLSENKLAEIMNKYFEKGFAKD